VNHFRFGDPTLARLLIDAKAGLHPFVLGELAAGSLKNRSSTLGYFASLPQSRLFAEADVHGVMESRTLWGTGLGWVDLHILTSATMSGWMLYTADRAMIQAAHRLGIASPAIGAN
jgi:hypothetical protein